MLARTSASEVISCKKNLRGVAFGPVQNEVGLRLGFGVVAPVKEKLIPESGLRNRLQKTRGDDLIRVDIIDRQRSQPAGESTERFHFRP